VTRDLTLGRVDVLEVVLNGAGSAEFTKTTRHPSFELADVTIALHDEPSDPTAEAIAR
jgi:hypothetical protein